MREGERGAGGAKRPGSGGAEYFWAVCGAVWMHGGRGTLQERNHGVGDWEAEHWWGGPGLGERERAKQIIDPNINQTLKKLPFETTVQVEVCTW